jgi:hypothetical protein
MSAMKNLMMMVGTIQSGKPPKRSERAEPKQAAISVSRLPRNRTMRKMAASPKWAYPSGIGNARHERGKEDNGRHDSREAELARRHGRGMLYR